MDQIKQAVQSGEIPRFVGVGVVSEILRATGNSTEAYLVNNNEPSGMFDLLDVARYVGG